jgi:hypothetical protein
MEIPFCGVYIKDNKITVTILCYNCKHEIGFYASFMAFSEIPKLKPAISQYLKQSDYLRKGKLIRCPICSLYFVDDTNNGYSVEPWDGKPMEWWWYRAKEWREAKCSNKEARECWQEEQGKIAHLPSNLRTSEKSGKKRKKEKCAIIPMGKNVFESPA